MLLPPVLLQRRTKRSFVVVVALLTSVLMTISLTPTSASAAEPAVSASATALSVRAQGTSIVNGDGQPIKLYGVNRSGTEYMCQQSGRIFDGPADQASVNAMKSWGINFVRIPLNELCWLDRLQFNNGNQGAPYRQAIVDYVNLLNANGIYTAVDLHFSDPNGPSDGSWARQDALMANAFHSEDFWSSVAATFKGNRAMIFELFNEPHAISWPCLRDGCNTPEGPAIGNQTMIDAIRATGATQPIIVNGLDWGHDMSQWLQHVPTDPAGQIVAGQHLYNFKDQDTVAEWNAQFLPVMRQYPIIATELGLGEWQCGEDSTITDFIKWMDANGGDGVGVWAFNVGSCPASSQYGGASLLQDESGMPTAFGAHIKAYYLSKVGATPPSPTTTTTQPPATVLGEQISGGYRVVTEAGEVHGFGNQTALGNAPVGSSVVAIANTKDGGGYWLATRDGRVYPRGNAPVYGDLAGKSLNGSIVGMATTTSGNGYWLLGSDGGVFSFGDAAFYGSTGNEKLNSPALSLTPTPTGKGYWFVAGDGGVFSFGDAAFHGSTGSDRLNQPVVGMAAHPSGKGYWLVASDGGIFAFGVNFYGSMGDKVLNAPIVDMVASPGGDGYQFVATDGGVFNFGNSTYYGSLGDRNIASKVRDITA